MLVRGVKNITEITSYNFFKRAEFYIVLVLR